RGAVGRAVAAHALEGPERDPVSAQGVPATRVCRGAGTGLGQAGVLRQDPQEHALRLPCLLHRATEDLYTELRGQHDRTAADPYVVLSRAVILTDL
ncbi:MAG: hypothetical protein OCU18_09545, partial [Candidatus Syntrophoarchaeum sp.]|nr:hypothetical protein [Candidatus Syntrophoarchaeum sp.]